jgi:hypothetical protein
MSTWGISGPQFLLLYLVLFAVTVLGVVLARRRALASDGAARVVAGSANGRPVGLLVGFLLVTVVVAAALAGRVPNATELGRRTLQTLRAEHPRPGSGASPAQLSMATALFGAGSCGRPTPTPP